MEHAKSEHNPKGAGRHYKGGRDRTATLQIRLTEEEHTALKTTAYQMRTTVASVFRDCINFTEQTKGTLPVNIKGKLFHVTEQEAKDLYKQLTQILIG